MTSYWDAFSGHIRENTVFYRTDTGRGVCCPGSVVDFWPSERKYVKESGLNVRLIRRLSGRP